MDRAEQGARAQRFAAMHRGAGILVLPNAWDVASARVLVDAGFAAVATTSGGCAFSLGHCDGERIGRDGMAAVVRRMAAAVAPVPLNADMEAGYGPRPEDVADTVAAALAAGAAGVNIEDGVPRDRRGEAGYGAGPLFDRALAVERIAAARAAADAAGIPAVLNARTDGFHFGEGAPVFDEAVRRANAYLAAGADCAFVPFVRDETVIGALARAIDGPLNVLAGPGTPPVPALAALGVRRVTVGSAIAKAALSLVRRAADELKGPGTYGFAQGAFSQGEIHAILGGG